MLAGAGAVHGEGPLDQAMMQGIRFLELVRIAIFRADAEMKVSIADVAQDWREPKQKGSNKRGQKQKGSEPFCRQVLSNFLQISWPASATIAQSPFEGNLYFNLETI